jgi:hypothetical protein
MSRFILVALDGHTREKCTELQRGMAYTRPLFSSI